MPDECSPMKGEVVRQLQKIPGVIPARLDSKRLPGKVLRSIGKRNLPCPPSGG